MGNKILSYKQVHSTLGCKRKLATHVFKQNHHSHNEKNQRMHQTIYSSSPSTYVCSCVYAHDESIQQTPQCLPLFVF